MIRRWIFRILVIAFIWAVVTSWSDLTMLFRTVRQGQWQWVLLAAAIQIVFYALYALLYRMAFTVVGVRSRLRELIPLTYASLSVNFTAPAGGAAGATLFVDDAARRGESPARAAAGTLLVMVTNYGSFGLVLLAGLLSLLIHNELHWYEISAAAVLFFFVSSVATVLMLGLWRPHWLHHVFEQVQNAVNWVGGWFQHPPLLAEDWSSSNAADFIEAAHSMARHPVLLLSTFGVALLSHLVQLGGLYVLFVAFNRTVSLSILVAGYAMTILFWIVSPTPNGVGIVEGLMPVIYASLGLPMSEATVVSLTFRGLSLWVPMLVGFFLLHRIRTFRRVEQTVTDARLR